MALLYGTGFDLCTSATDAALDGWTQTSGGGGDTWTVDTTNGRQGGTCLSAARGSAGGNTQVGWFRNLTTVGATGFVGVAMSLPVVFIAGLISVGTAIIALVDSGSTQLVLSVNPDGSLSVQRGSTLLGSSAAGTVTSNTYHYYEMGYVLATGTGGSVTVKVDGTTVLTLTGVNTQQTTNASWNRVLLGGLDSAVITQATNVPFRWDDLYICDNSGSQNNTFLGDVSFNAILPTGDGSNAGFTQVGGTAGHNYTSVNEKPQNSDTSYVVSGAVGTIDTYDYPALYGTTTSVLAVLARYVVRKDNTYRHLTARHRLSGSEADFTATDMDPLTTYSELMQIQEINPVTATAWAPADITGGEFGFRVSL